VFRGLLYLVLLFLVLWGGYRYYENQELPIVGGSLDDAANLASVKAAFALHRDLAERPISVRSRKGVVTLSGQVASDAEKEEAGDIAASVVGIERIENLMAVNPELTPELTDDEVANRRRSLGQRLDDVSLAAKVKASITLHKELKGLDIMVRARDGTVYLEGTVETPEQSEIASRRASVVTGADRVENELLLDGSIEELADEITEALADSENLEKYDLRASAADGSIILQGRVETNAERELAELLAQRVAGSRDVINRIESNGR
jgi:osmotically-inducible protein OsmY